MARIRDFFLQRNYNNSLRYADQCSRRTQPSPLLPDGVNHGLSANDYHLRDQRSKVSPPLEIYAAGPKRIADSERFVLN